MNESICLGLMVLAAIYILARIAIWILFLRRLDQLQGVISQGQAILREHGSTIGELRAAGVLDELNRLEAWGGKLYRSAVPFAAFLMWWPAGPRLRKKHLMEAAAQAGIFGKNTRGSMQSWRDLCRGSAPDTGYYPIGHLAGLYAALDSAGLLW